MSKTSHIAQYDVRSDLDAMALERLVEDGNPAGIEGSFMGTTQGIIYGPSGIYHPGETASITFNLDPSTDHYFSFLSMAIPSNDAFIGNDNPMAYQISSGGLFQNQIIDVYGSMLWDVGTEMNDEVPANTPLLGQMAANTGLTENGLVGLHGGFLKEVIS